MTRTAQQRVVQPIRQAAPAVQRWGGRILMVAGAWFIALAVFADFVRVLPVSP